MLDRESLALGCAAIVTVMPGFALDVARVSNDCLAVVLFTALTWMAVEAFQGRGNALPLGATLGLGLLTKVYFLTAIVMLAVLVIRRSWRVAAGAVVIAAAIAGWWYGRNIMTTGTLSGLSEAVALRGTGVLDMLRKARALPWRTAIDSILFSHLFFGGWSSLKVRSWMYHVFYWFIPFAGIGLVREKRRPEVQALAAIYFAFWIGQLYNVLLIFASKGVPTSMGWYLYAVIGAEVVLCVLGLQQLLPERIQNWAALPGVVLFALLDLYAMHAVSIPYYTGLIRHRPNGALAAVHIADFRAAGFGDDLRTPYVFKNIGAGNADRAMGDLRDRNDTGRSGNCELRPAVNPFLRRADFYQAILFNVNPRDPLTLAMAAALMVAIGLGACLLPARRAMSIDPSIALREE